MIRAGFTAAISAALVCVGAAFVAAQQQGAQTPPGLQNATAKAQAQLKDKAGKDAGTVILGQFQGAVVIHGDLRGIEPGWHAIHVHEVGKCEPDFNAAGDHFNPGHGKHGLDEAHTHAGDLPNFYVGEDGTARFELTTTLFSLGVATASGAAERASQASGATGGAVSTAAAGAAPPIFDGDGASIVVHAKPDDYHSEPSGGSGDRVACGVINRS